jgi:hypothetical protein
MKKIFKYLEPLWTGKDGKISLRNLGAMALMVDFVINMHNSAAIVTKVLKLYVMNKAIDPAVIAAMSGNLAQISMMLITEATLIAALLALRTWQNNKDGFTQTSINTTTPVDQTSQVTVVTNQQPVEQVTP